MILDNLMNLDTRQYRKGLQKLSNGFDIAPHKFSKITGISQTLIDKILQQDTITFNFDDPQSITSFDNMSFVDIELRENTQAVESMIGIYQISIDAIALYCAVFYKNL